jgi:hypothetical protein
VESPVHDGPESRDKNKDFKEAGQVSGEAEEEETNVSAEEARD